MLESDFEKLRVSVAAVEQARLEENAAFTQTIETRDQLITKLNELVANQDKMITLYQAELILLKGYTVLTEPLKAAAMDADGWVEGVVAIDLARIIDLGHEGVLDELSTLLTGNDLLQDFSWDVVGWDHTRPGCDVLHIKVTGNASSCFREDE